MINSDKSFLFPGQGSQSVGMLTDIDGQFTEVQQTFDRASLVLGYNLWDLVAHGPAEELDKTAHTQPALLAASYAIWLILASVTRQTTGALAGHSLGEYTALVCAGALTFEDAIRVVAARGQYMQAAVAPGEGAMAAIIGLDPAAVETLCKEAKESSTDVLSPANYNSIGQIVIAGHTAAVLRAISLAKASGARLAKLIPVSVPSHCALMKPAAEELEALLLTMAIRQPELPVLNNVDVAFYDTPDSIRSGLVRQLYEPVRWVEVVQKIANMGAKHLIECGPGKVLTGLNKRIVGDDVALSNTSDLSNLQILLQNLKG